MNTLLAIDLGCHNMHFAEGVFHKNKANVHRCFSFPVPEGSIVRDMVTYPQLLADAIQSYAQSSGVHAKEVVLTMNADFATVRDVDLPLAKPKELEAMIRNEMADSFYISQSDILQFKEIDRVTSDIGESLTRYRVAAIDSEIVENFFNVMKLTKLKIRGMDINLNSIDKLFSTVNKINNRDISEKAVMLIDHGHSVTTLYIIDKKKPVFFRRLPLGSKEIDHLVSESLQVSAAEARNMKERELSFFNGSEKPSAIFSELNPYFNKFNDEIRKIISFHNNRPGVSLIEHVFLFGNGSKLAGLSENLSANLGLSVELIDSLENVTIPADLTLDVGHLNAIGALIRYDK